MVMVTEDRYVDNPANKGNPHKNGSGIAKLDNHKNWYLWSYKLPQTQKHIWPAPLKRQITQRESESESAREDILQKG